MLKKANQNLAGAAVLGRARLWDAAASRMYYALFQAAVYVLGRRGRRPRDLSRDATDDRWAHAIVLNNTRLLRNRPEDRTLFHQAYALRVKGDYEEIAVEEIEVKELQPRVEAFLKEACS